MEHPFNDLDNSLNTYYQATGISLALIDANGDSVSHYGPVCTYCDLLRQDSKIDEWCKNLHLEAGEQSASIGECYFFNCHGNLTHFSIALLDQNRYIGSILAGPILMEYPDLSSIDEVAEKCHVPYGCISLLTSSMREVPLFTPKRSYYLGQLLYDLVYHTLHFENALMMENRRQHGIQQEMIGLSLQKAKNASATYQRNLQEKQEMELVELISCGKNEEAYILLNDILGGIYFSSGNDIELIKIRITELITVLSRRLTKLGMVSDEIFDLVNEFHKKSAGARNVNKLSEELADLLRRFIDIIESSSGADVSELVHTVLVYIQQHYREELSLDIVAEHAAVTSPYLSKRFKKEMGIGLSNYINEFRIKKAAELLENSNLSLAEIAQAVGYSNQQYFTRIFTKMKKKSPGEYRRTGSGLPES